MSSDLRIDMFRPSDYIPLSALLTAVRGEPVDPATLRDADAALPPRDQFARDPDGRLAGFGRRHLLAWHGDDLLGRALLWRAPWTRPGCFASEIDVLSGHPGADAALRALLADQLAWAAHIGAAAVMGVLDDRQVSQLAIFEEFGYRRDAHIVQADLDWPPDAVRLWENDIVRASARFEQPLALLALGDLRGKARAVAERSIYTLFEATLPDNPGHTDALPPFDQWHGETLGPPDARPDWIILAQTAAGDDADPEIVGLSMLLPAGDDTAYVDYTAVRSDWRGRGLAGVLKRRAMVQAATDGVRHFVTEWDTRNMPIERANLALGFTVRGGHYRIMCPLS